MVEINRANNRQLYFRIFYLQFYLSHSTSITMWNNNRHKKRKRLLSIAEIARKSWMRRQSGTRNAAPPRRFWRAK